MNTKSNLISRSAGLLNNRSAGVPYLQYLYVTSLVLICTSNLGLHLR